MNQDGESMPRRRHFGQPGGTGLRQTTSGQAVDKSHETHLIGVHKLWPCGGWPLCHGLFLLVGGYCCHWAISVN